MCDQITIDSEHGIETPTEDIRESEMKIVADIISDIKDTVVGK